MAVPSSVGFVFNRLYFLQIENNSHWWNVKSFQRVSIVSMAYVMDKRW